MSDHARIPTPIRNVALKIPALRRIVAQRDALYAENAALKRRQPAALPDLRSQVGALCTVVNPAHWLDAEWLAIHHDLSRYASIHEQHVFQNVSGEINRKGWEWTHCLYGLRRLGMLQPGKHGVGVGVGRECVIFYLADHVARVTATDLYGEAGWSTHGGREADLSLLEVSKAACPPSVDFAKIAFENQDGTKLSYADDSFDFAWSLSSIEHFGSHDASSQAIAEMARVVRPGGIVAMATEYLLLPEYTHAEFFNRAEVAQYLVDPFHNLELVSPVDYHTLTYEFLLDSVIPPYHRHRRHVILNDGQVQSTSILLFYRVLG